MNSCSNVFIDSVTNFSTNIYKEEARRDETIQERKEIEQKVEENIQEEIKEEASLFDFSNRIIDEEEEQPKVEEPTPVVEEVKEEPKPVVVQEQPKVEVVQVSVGEANYSAPFVIKNERDATKYENFLLESDPRLKKGQAHFYARHCTVGMFYTIKQYKRMTGCVYETARTSMDSLAEYGYYEKQQIKNKFIYTPAKRK